MNRIAKLLQQPINKTLRIWHLVTLMVLIWIVPAFLPDSFLQQWTPVFIAVWVVAYILIGKYMKSALRKTAVDVILVERFVIFASFMLPTVMSLVTGFRHGFDTVTTIGLVLFGTICALLLLGIVLHVRNTDKFYHGVKKDKLFEE